ncbi:MAG: hypothetical protein BVN35_00660 [Proteobacteria bacterium ST_bin11]|jgi:hypothetical protein|nr:MAG: hypothetical protein BVN35_00660 [Proteobacteria bacterium ST_bin11]
MKAAQTPERAPANSLSAQIASAERQLSVRRQAVGKRSSSLLGKIHAQMTAPATLLLASSVGFIAGELSNCKPPRPAPTHRPSENSQAAASRHLRDLLGLLLSAHTLYNALPISWLRKYFRQARTKPATGRHHGRAPGATLRSNRNS